MASVAKLPPPSASNDKNIEMSFSFFGNTRNNSYAIKNVHFIFEGFKTKIQADAAKLGEKICPFICTRTKEGSSELVTTNPSKLKVSLKQIESLKIVVDFFDFTEKLSDKANHSEEYSVNYKKVIPNENVRLLMVSVDLQLQTFFVDEFSVSSTFMALEGDVTLSIKHQEFSSFLIGFFAASIKKTIEFNLNKKIENCDKFTIKAIQTEVKKIDPNSLKERLQDLIEGLETMANLSKQDLSIFRNQKFKLALEMLPAHGLANIMRMTLQSISEKDPIAPDRIEQFSNQFAIQLVMSYM